MEGQSGRKALGLPQLPRGTAGSLLAEGTWARAVGRGGGVETSCQVPTGRQPARPTAEDSSPQHPFPSPANESAPAGLRRHS